MTIYKESSEGSLDLKELSNEEIVQTYLLRYRHSQQSVKTRKHNLTYFFNKNRFGYIGSIFSISKKVLYDYFDYLNNLADINFTTKKMKWTILKSFLGFCMEYYDDFLVVIPQKTIQWGNNHKIANTNKYVIASKEEIKAILNYYKNIKRDTKYYLIFRILIETGMRKGELINIDVDKIIFEKRYIDTFGKSGRKIYYISKELTELLENYIKNERKVIFVDTNKELEALFISKRNKRYGIRVFNQKLKKCLRDLGIDKNISCHTFRRTINTCRKIMGCPAEDRKILLNHKTNDVNLESYIVLDYIQFIELYDKWDPYKELNL